MEIIQSRNSLLFLLSHSYLQGSEAFPPHITQRAEELINYQITKCSYLAYDI